MIGNDNYRYTTCLFYSEDFESSFFLYLDDKILPDKTNIWNGQGHTIRKGGIGSSSNSYSRTERNPRYDSVAATYTYYTYSSSSSFSSSENYTTTTTYGMRGIQSYETSSTYTPVISTYTTSSQVAEKITTTVVNGVTSTTLEQKQVTVTRELYTFWALTAGAALGEVPTFTEWRTSGSFGPSDQAYTYFGGHAADLATGIDFTGIAESSEVLVVFSETGMPFTAGKTCLSTQLTWEGGNYPLLDIGTTTETEHWGWGEDDYDTYTRTYIKGDYGTAFLTYDTMTKNPGTIQKLSFEFFTISAPVSYWYPGMVDTTTQILAGVTVNTYEENWDADFSPFSGSGSYGRENSYSESSSYSYSESSSFAKTMAFPRLVLKYNDIPIYGTAYLVARNKTGWVVPKEGFHTQDPASTLNETFSFFDTGAARPGVLLYPPLGASIGLPREQKTTTYFAGEGVYLPLYEGPKNALKKTSSAWGNGTESTVAFSYTVTAPNGEITKTSPDVFRIQQTGVTAEQSSTIIPQGAGGSFLQGGSYAGGYPDLQMTWTLVVEGRGLLIGYGSNGSSTTHFTKPTTSSYSGSDATLFSFIPDASERVVAVPRYYYE